MASLLNMSGGSLLGKGLPYDAEIEYLESSGTQYIDTCVVPTMYSGVVGRIEYSTKQPNVFIIGMRQDGGKSRFWLGTNGFSSLNFSIGDYSGYDAYNLLKNTLYDFQFNYNKSKKLIWSNVEFVIELFTNFAPTLSFYLFAANNQGSASYFSSIKIYHIQIYDGITLVRDFIPVRVGTTGYLYDKVSGQLFGNSGTGDFILGADKH